MERFRPLAEGRPPSGLGLRCRHARSLTIDQVVVEDVDSQAEKRLRPAPVPYFKETKRGLVLSGTNQDALQALFGDDVTACFGKRVQLEPTPMRVAGREPIRHAVTGVIRLKAAPTAAPAGSNGTGPKAPAGEKVRTDGPAVDNGAEPHPKATASSQDPQTVRTRKGSDALPPLPCFVCFALISEPPIRRSRLRINGLRRAVGRSGNK